MEVSWNRGISTPKSWILWYFPYKQSSYGGTPMTMEPPMTKWDQVGPWGSPQWPWWGCWNASIPGATRRDDVTLEVTNGYMVNRCDTCENHKESCLDTKIQQMLISNGYVLETNMLTTCWIWWCQYHQRRWSSVCVPLSQGHVSSWILHTARWNQLTSRNRLTAETRLATEQLLPLKPKPELEPRNWRPTAKTSSTQTLR